MTDPPRPVELVTVAPGHFHAALVQKHALPGVDPRVRVYAPLDDDLVRHLGHVAGFNSRRESPTGWELDVRAGGDWFERWLCERPGNTVVLAGRNRPKADLVLAAARAGYGVMCDKPWAVEPADLSRIEEAFREAERHGAVLWDVMTERFEAANALVERSVRDAGVFGEWVPGTPDEPALTIESTHHLLKAVAGSPLRRPAWWYDPSVAGEGIADVGTHLADQAIRLIAGEEPLDPADVRVLTAERWPLTLSRAEFAASTGLADFPPELRPWVSGDVLSYFGNGSATAVIRGVHVRLTVLWEVGPSAVGDTHSLVARGTRGTIRIEPHPASGVSRVFVGPAEVPIPADRRVGHEECFAAVLAEYVWYFRRPAAVPAWERSHLLAKYRLTTGAVELARASG